MTYIRTSALLIATAIIAGSQTGSQTAGQPTPATDKLVKFSAGTQLVIETVSVTDKNGKPIENLTAKDFIVTEDGVRQSITVFQYQKLDETALPPIGSAPVAKNVTANSPPSETAEVVDALSRRRLVLYFDMGQMTPDEQFRVIHAAQKFVTTQMKASDVLSVVSYLPSGAVKVLQDFTADRDRLMAALEAVVIEDTDPDTVIAADTGAAFGQDPTQLNLFTTDRQLSALQTAVDMLKGINERKSLIYFVSGLNLNGTNNQAQLQATINAAVRSNVALYPTDARGLVASAPLGNATQGSPGGIGMFTGVTSRQGANRFQQSQDALYALGKDTGGNAMLDTNDLGAGIVQAQQAMSSYYVIGYNTTNAALDGKFRRVKVALQEVEGAKLGDYRQGYYAGKTFAKFTAADKERQLEDALLQGDPITDLTLALELNYFRMNSYEYFIPMNVKIPGRELVLAKRGGADHTLIDFIGEIKDDYGATLQNVRDKVDIKFGAATAVELANRSVEYDTGFTLLPGKYVLKFLARDAETGRIGTFRTNFTVPDLSKDDKQIPISSVVLGSQKVDFKDAIYNARKNLTPSPLVENGRKLIPAIGRVFSKNREIFVYLQAYQTSAANSQPLAAIVTLLNKDRQTVFQSPAVAGSPNLQNKSMGVPLQFSLLPADLPLGDYTCQITVLQPGGQKASFWQDSIRLVQ